jgi:hypothetical protein
MRQRKTRYSSVRELKQAREWFKEHPEGTVKVCGIWPEKVYNKTKWNQWFMDCLNRKINRNESPRGRKEDPDWQRAMRQSADRINHPRLIINWLPPELKGRFAHRLRENMV